jgi:hypothetical protein
MPQENEAKQCNFICQPLCDWTRFELDAREQGVLEAIIYWRCKRNANDIDAARQSMRAQSSRCTRTDGLQLV